MIKQTFAFMAKSRIKFLNATLERAKPEQNSKRAAHLTKPQRQNLDVPGPVRSRSKDGWSQNYKSKYIICSTKTKFVNDLVKKSKMFLSTLY